MRADEPACKWKITLLPILSCLSLAAAVHLSCTRDDVGYFVWSRAAFVEDHDGSHREHKKNRKDMQRT